MKNFYPFLNPFQWLKAYQYAKKTEQFDKSQYDLELFLYSKILTNNMLHYGYFNDPNIKPEDISFALFEEAQMNYAHNIVNQIKDSDKLVLDVGCGMGGLSNLLKSKGFNVEALTPNKNQIEFVKANFPEIPAHKTKFEKFDGEHPYGTIINSESLQYIQLDEAFKQTERLIEPGGRWIIVDYFSKENKGENKRPHHLDTFYKKVDQYGWKVSHAQDITPNIMPTLYYIEMYVKRFLDPVKHFAYEKLRYKKPSIYFLSEKLRGAVDKKINKEVRTILPEVFQRERTYQLIVLDKKTD